MHGIEPEYTDIRIGEEIAVTLPAFSWIQIGELLAKYQDDNQSCPHGVTQLLNKLATVFMTPASIKAHEAHEPRPMSMSDVISQVMAAQMPFTGDDDDN